MVRERVSSVIKKTTESRVTLGLLIDWLGTPYHSKVLSGISDFAREKNVNLLAFVTGRLHSNYEWEKCRNLLFSFVDENNVDGLLVMAPSIGNIVGLESVGDLLKQYTNIPIVTIGEKYQKYPCVSIDNESGMQTLLKHLIENHGFKRIAYILGPRGNTEADARFRAYTEVLKKYNIPLDWDLVIQGDFLIFSGRNAVKTLMDERKVKFDVIVASNDTMALGVMEELRQRKIQVPEDIPVVGFDDIEISQYAKLSTVKQPFYAQGKEAADVLYHHIQGKQVPPITLLPTELIIRDSCGCYFVNPQIPIIETLQIADNDFVSVILQNKNQVFNEIKKLKGIEGQVKGSVLSWAEKILEAFLEEVNGKKRNVFLQIWNKVIFLAIAEKVNLVLIRDIFSIIKKNILSLSAGQKMLLFIESLFQQAEGMIEEAVQRTEAFHRILFDYELEEINDIGEKLMANLELEDEIKVAYQEFPGFGIKQCYLSLYEDPEKPLKYSKLVLGYNEKGILPIQKGGIRFPTKNLLPPDLFPSSSRFSMLVEDLFQGYEQIGFVLFDMGARELQTYEILRHKMSIALKGSMLIGRIKNQAEYLEEEVKERTADLLETNKRLEKEIQDRKKAEENLRNSEERFREIALLLPTIVIETDINLGITFINKAGYEALDLSDSELKMDFSLLDFVYTDDRKRFEEYCERVVQGSSPNFREFRMFKKSGAIITLMTKASPIYKNGAIEGIRWNAIDIKPLMSSVIMPEDSFFKEHKFSPREKEVLLLMLQGHKIKDIAKKLFITESTIKGHIGAIYTEIGVKNRSEFFQLLEEYQINHFGYQSFIFSMISKLVKD